MKRRAVTLVCVLMIAVLALGSIVFANEESSNDISYTTNTALSETSSYRFPITPCVLGEEDLLGHGG